MEPIHRMRIVVLCLALLLASLAIVMVFIRIEEKVACEGTVEPAVLLVVRAKEARIIKTIEVEEGDEVKAGAILARLDVRDLEEALLAQEERIGVLRSAREVAVAALARVEASGFQERLELAQLELKKAEQREKVAAGEIARIRKLYDQDWASESQLEKAEAAAQIAAIDVEAARQRLVMLENDPDLRRVEEARAEVAHVDAQLEAAAAAKERLSRQLRESVVVATQPGRVIAILVDEGELPAPGAELFALDGGGGTIVRARLPELAMEKLAVGQRARISSPAFAPRLYGYARGKLSFIGESVSLSSSAPYLEGIVKIEEQPFPLKYGNSVRVEVIVDSISPFELVLGRKRK